MAQYVDTIKVLFPKFLLACFMGMQTWRQQRQKTNKFTMGTSRQMTTLSHQTNPEAHTMLKDKFSVFSQFICMNAVFRNALREENGECVAGRCTRGRNAFIVCPNNLDKYFNYPSYSLTSGIVVLSH